MAREQARQVPENARQCVICGDAFYAFRSSRKVACDKMECKTGVRSRMGRTHGLSRSRLHSIWVDMKSRCNGTGSGVLVEKYYRSKGIRVCDEWSDFVIFHEWAMATGYTEELEIDRRDPDGNYEPSNCRWATRSQQLQNMRKKSRRNVTSRFIGVQLMRKLISNPWRAVITVNGRTSHIGVFPTEEEAARARDVVSKELFGEFAQLNFQ